MNPRASMPTTASTMPGLKFPVSRLIVPANSRASARTGVMSLNWMPGLGKSGTLRMGRSISEGVGVWLMSGWVVRFRFVVAAELVAGLGAPQVHTASTPLIVAHDRDKVKQLQDGADHPRNI